MRTAFVAIFVLLVLGTSTLKAQTNITIGTGTDYYYVPLPGWYGWQYEVYLYDASTINTSGYITKIAYDIAQVTSNSSTSSFQIYMKDVPTSFSLATGTTFNDYISGASLVYSNSSYSTPSTGWNTFTLTNQFCHDASKSLLVAVKGIGCGTSGSCSKQSRYTEVSSTHWFKRQDSSDPGASVSGSIDNKRANIILTFNGSCSSSSDPCSNVTPMSCGVTYSGTLGTSGVWSSYTSSTYSEPGEERVYSFTPTISGEYTFTGTNDSGDADFFLMSSCGTSGTNMTGGNWSLGSRTVTLTAGTTYYLIADNYSSSNTASYTISVTCPASDCEDVTIGTGTSCSNLYAPVNDYWNYNYRQIIYPATSLTPGAIYSLSFQYCYTTAMSSKTSVNIYMGHTSQSAFANSTSWVSSSNLTLVYSGTLNCSTGWNTFNLNTPFQYNGVDNLVLAIDDNSGSYDGSSYTFYYSAGSGNVMLTYNSDGTNPDPSSPPSGTLYSNYPNTKFCIESNCTPRTLSFDNSTINIASCSGTASQTARISPSAGGTITWRSSNPSVAEVSSSGVVTAHSLGTAVITATVSASGDYCPASGSYTVSVTGSSHTLTYNTTANCSGGSASTAPASVSGTSATVTSTEPTCSSRPYFLGWNTAANGTGTHYSAGSTVDLACADVTLYAQYSTEPPVITGSSDCETAQAFCATNDNTGYTLEVEGDQDIPYPTGMCSFFVNPTWWYVRISESGPIEMEIASSCGDVDFGCWGPFVNPTCDIENDLSTPSGLPFAYYSGASYASYWGPSYNGTSPTTSTTTSSAICSTYALAEPVGNLVDFGGSTSHTEYLQIPNAQVGEIYVVLIANFADCAGTINYTQSNITDPSAGRSDCTIVNDCNITSITTILGDCASDQTFSVSGNINFTDPPVDGTLTISCGSISQVFYPPFVSPVSYSLSGIPGNGAENVLITASFSASNCERPTYINAPMCEIDCPDATVSMTGYTEVIGDRYYFDVCLGSAVNMDGVQTGYTNPSWRWSINPHGGVAPYVVNTHNASYTPGAEQGYDVSLTVSEGECRTVVYGRIRVSDGLTTSLDSYDIGNVCVGDSREISVGGTGSDIQVTPAPHSIETSLGHAETTFIPDGTNCSTQCYTSNVTFYDFNDGDVVTNVDAIKYIKLNTEHSFIGDVQIKITCPNGRSAVILPDYFSSNPEDGSLYSSNAIDPYTYVWPDRVTTTRWRVGTSATNWYHGGHMLGRYEVFEDQNEAYTTGGYTYYLASFSSASDAQDFIANYLSRYYSGRDFVVYRISDSNDNTLYYVIGYTYEGDEGYIVWLTRDNTTETNSFSFPSQAAAQYFLTYVCGGNGVISSYQETSSYRRIFMGEPDFSDVLEADNLTSSQICDGSNPHNLAGTGYDYAWTSSSQYTTVGYVYDLANLERPSATYTDGTAESRDLYHVLPSNVDAGTQMYQPFQSFSNLIGCPLNGTWSISVCDSWNYDNGYVFDWEIALSEDLLPSNWDYTVDFDGVSNDCGSIATVSGNDLIIAPQAASNGEQTCNIILSDNLGCTTNIPLSYTAVAPTITHVSGDEDQTVCEDQPITDIVYTLGGSAVSATATGLPAGVSLSISGNTVTVSGSPDEHDTYNFTITTISQTGLHCTEATVTGRIIVNEGNITPTFDQAGPYCEGTTVEDLPTTSTNGITGRWTPNITNATNTYTFTPDAGQCATITTMLITVNPRPTLSYTSGSETLCKGESSANIVFTYGGGANGAAVTGLPTGLEFNVNTSNHTIVITGTTNVTAGTYNYTVTTTGAVSPCENISEERTITVTDPATITLTSGTSPQTVCEGNNITDFVFTYTGATGAEATNLPDGLTATLNTSNQTLTVSGLPTEAGTFTVSTTGATSPCSNVSTTASIVINDPAELELLSATPDVVLCVEVPWYENIQYSFGGAATGATVSGLPDGITYSVSGNVVTISGTPSIDVEAGEYTYTVTTTGVQAPCENKSLTGVISISTNATLVLTSAAGTDNQSICIPGTFTNIVYTYGGGATGIDEQMLADALPAGLEFTVNASAHTVTIYGTPTETGTFHYTVATTGVIPPCKPEEKYGTITISESVQLTATGNTTQSFCLGNDLENIVFTYGGGATGVSIDGTLPAGVSQNLDNSAHTLTLSGTPTQAGTYTFNVTTTGATDPCSDVDEQVSITVYETPEVEINASADAICNGSSVSLASSPATFSSYSWTCPTTSDATHTITSGMPASSTTSSINVSPTVTPGSADVVYVLRVTNGSNCTATVSHTVNVSSTATADIVKADNTMCIDPFNGSITVSNFAGGATGSTYTVTATGQTAQTTTGGTVTFSNLEAGTYTVRVTNETTSEDCYTEQTLTVGDNRTNPTVSISGSLSICEGTNTTLTAHGANGLEAYTYEWSTGITGPELVTPDLTTQTSYSVTVTDANNCTADNTVTVEIGDTPAIEVIAENACLNDNVVLQAHVSNAGTGYTVTWTATPSAAAAGLTTTMGERITVTPTTSDTYTYTATVHANSCGTSGEFTISDDETITIYPLPTATVNPTVAVIDCSNNGEVSAIAGGGVSYAWSNSINTAENTFNTAGSYQVTVTDNNGCSGTAGIDVSSDMAEPDLTVTIAEGSSELVACRNDAIKIIAETNTTGAHLEYQGNTVDNPYLQFVSVDMVDPVTGIYEFEITSVAPNGCTHTETLVITRDDNVPSVTINTPAVTTLDCVTSSINLSATGTGTFTWTPSNVATHENYPAGGEYIVTASYDNGCIATASINIGRDVEAPVAHITPSTADNPTLTCSVQSIDLIASVESGNATYAWYQGPHEDTYTVHGPGTYTVTATLDNGCAAVATVYVAQDGDLPQVSIEPPAEIMCDPNFIELVVNVSPAGTQLIWEDGVDPTHITAPGQYTVTAEAPNGCRSQATTTVYTNADVPNLVITPPATTVLNCHNSTSQDSNYDIPIELVATSSTAGTMLSWEGGASTAGSATLEVLAPGFYTVTARATNGCETEATIEITEDHSTPNVLIGNNSNTNVLTCSGPSISVSLIDDSDADDYVWSGGENLTGTGNAFTEAAIYYVTATAPNGCTAVDQIEITSDFAEPTVSITNNTGTPTLTCDVSRIDVTASAQMPVGSTNEIVSYSWSGGLNRDQASNSFTTIGFYNVTATADNGCTGTEQIEITETMGRPHVDIIAPNTTLTCGTTALTITATGDADSYAWSGGLDPGEAVNIVENTGVYTVTATASNGCTAVSSVTITENLTPPTVRINSQSGFSQIDCRNDHVHAIATGTGVLYEWTTDGSTVIHTGAEFDLTAHGTYTVIATGENGCNSTAYIVVTEDNTPPVPNIISENNVYEINCNNSNTGISLLASGGIEYFWDNGSTSPRRTVMSEGEYRVTVTGSNGCVAETSITIDEDMQTPTATITNVTSPTNLLNCEVTSIQIIAEGGYMFAWNNSLWGGGPEQTVTSPGIYTVTVTARNGCNGTASIDIRSDLTPPNVTIEPVSGSYEINCRTEWIDVTAYGNGLSYYWSGGNNSTGYNNRFVSPGRYTVTVYGFNGCSNTATVQISSNYTVPTIGISNETGQNEIDCDHPSIHVVMTGTESTYRWNDDYTTGDRTFVQHGQYSVTATAVSNGCTASTSIGINENTVPPVITITTNPETTELNCHTTSITLTANGAQSYVWDTGASSQSINVTVGDRTYEVIGRASNGCTNSASIRIAQAPEFNVEISSIGEILCYGGTTSVSVSASGGNPGYSYMWSTGQTSATATDLASGNYTVTVSDSGGCSVALQCYVPQPLELRPTIVARDLQCGVVQGSLNAVVVGGTQPYNYIWSNNAVTSENSGLAVGSYGLTVVDANGCIASAEAQVQMQGMLSVNAVVSQPISCHGYNDGIVSASCPNATEPLFYAWNTGNASPEIYNLFEGAYMVTVTDAWGCTGQAGINLVSPPEMNLQTYIEEPLCYDSRDGKIVATAFGGLAPYTYLWNTSSTENEIANVGMGTYSLTITDAAGCSAVKTMTLEAPAAISVGVTASEIKCNGDKDGKIDVTATGGVEPYSYSIDGLVRPSMVSVFNNLNAGYYVVRVTDNNGCEATESALVYQPDALIMNIAAENPFCRNSRTGQIEINTIGGVEPYMYYMNSSKSDASLMPNIPSGEYVLYVVDANDCKSDEVTVTLTDVDVPCLRIPNVFTPNGDGVNDTWIIDNIEMFPAAEVYVFNRWGQLMFTSKGYAEDWDGSYRGHFVPAGTYMYIIDLFNDEEPYKGYVTILY